MKTPRVNPGGGRNKQIFENEEEIRGFYCNTKKTRKKWEKEVEEIRNFGQNIYPRKIPQWEIGKALQVENNCEMDLPNQFKQNFSISRLLFCQKCFSDLQIFKSTTRIGVKSRG